MTCSGASLRRAEGLRGVWFRPRRERFAEASAVARDADSPADAWERMAARAIVPFDWVGSSTRAFVGCAPDAPLDLSRPSETPPTTAACVAYASDAPGVLAAEELARETLARLAPWTAFAPRRVVWASGDAVVPLSLDASGFKGLNRALYNACASWAKVPYARHHRSDRSQARRAARQRLTSERSERWRALFEAPFEHEVAELSHDLARTLRLWELAAREHLHLTLLGPLVPGRRREIVATPVARIASPFEPLLALYARGYGLGPVTRDAVCLTALEP